MAARAKKSRSTKSVIPIYVNLKELERPKGISIDPKLIRKSDLSRKSVDELIGQLDIARIEIFSMASNPLFLNLLCEHIKSGLAFPENAHAVFETYITNRLTRDQKRLKQRFELDIL